MKSTILKLAVSAACLTGAAPAFANLVYVTNTQNTGTGLGAVMSVVTVQDNGTGSPGSNNIESGCVTYVNNVATPSTTCESGTGVQGGDNTASGAGNNLYYIDTITGLTSAAQLGFTVNVSEGNPSGTATLTNLYLSLYNTQTGAVGIYSYVGDPLVLGEGGGIGQSGKNQFVLDKDQALAAIAVCPVSQLSQCVVGGGIQFLENTTSATPETVYVGAFQRDDGVGGPGGGEVPEPGSVALLGVGALALTMLRRRYDGKK